MFVHAVSKWRLRVETVPLSRNTCLHLTMDGEQSVANGGEKKAVVTSGLMPAHRMALRATTNRTKNSTKKNGNERIER